MKSGDDANSEQNADATVKNVLGYMRFICKHHASYFLILFYSQAPQRACVVLEKSSKLMDTMLVSVKARGNGHRKSAQAFVSFKCTVGNRTVRRLAAGIWAVKTINIGYNHARSSRCLVIWDCSQASFTGQHLFFLTLLSIWPCFSTLQSPQLAVQ